MMRADRVAAAARTMARVVEIEKLLVNQIHILESMTPSTFSDSATNSIPPAVFNRCSFAKSNSLPDEAGKYS